MLVVSVDEEMWERRRKNDLRRGVVGVVGEWDSSAPVGCAAAVFAMEVLMAAGVMISWVWVSVRMNVNSWGLLVVS